MKTTKEIIDELNEMKIKQAGYDFEGIPDDIWDEYFRKAKMVDSEIHIHKHRWYETSITVFDTKIGFIGIRYVTGLFSDEIIISDIEWAYVFFEMEEVESTRYKIKLFLP